MVAETSLEELTRDELTREHVQHRVDDWADRIERLYERVERQLPPGWTAQRGPTVPMLEPLMEKMGLPERELPTLELLRDGVVFVKFRPDGLWIIPINGQIDIVKGRERYDLIDRAGLFEAADWEVTPAISRRDAKVFDRAWLEALLAT